jgi:hypothetical protein
VLSSVLLFSTAGQAATQVTVHNWLEGAAPAPLTCGLNIQNAANAPVEASCTTNLTASNFWAATDGSALAFGRAEVGRLCLSATTSSAAQMTSLGTVAASFNQASSHCSWTDNFTITSTNQPVGQLGEMTVNILIDGSLALASDYLLHLDWDQPPYPVETAGAAPPGQKLVAAPASVLPQTSKAIPPVRFIVRLLHWA